MRSTDCRRADIRCVAKPREQAGVRGPPFPRLTADDVNCGVLVPISSAGLRQACTGAPKMVSDVGTLDKSSHQNLAICQWRTDRHLVGSDATRPVSVQPERGSETRARMREQRYNQMFNLSQRNLKCHRL